MRWVAPTEKDDANRQLEKKLWNAADQFRANSGLKAGEYSGPVLGLIFLRFAEARFVQVRARLEKSEKSSSRRGSRIDDPKAYKAQGVLYLTPGARFEYSRRRWCYFRHLSCSIASVKRLCLWRKGLTTCGNRLSTFARRATFFSHG